MSFFCVDFFEGAFERMIFVLIEASDYAHGWRDKVGARTRFVSFSKASRFVLLAESKAG